MRTLLQCVYKGRSSWLQFGMTYVAISTNYNNTGYLVEREGYPCGKSYDNKHFKLIGVGVSQPDSPPDYLFDRENDL